MVDNIKRSLLVALWFVFLTFPLIVVKVNTLKSIVEWRWINMLWVAIGAFALSIVWRWAMARRQLKSKKAEQGEDELVKAGLGARLMEDPKLYRPVLAVILRRPLSVAASIRPFQIISLAFSRNSRPRFSVSA